MRCPNAFSSGKVGFQVLEGKASILELDFEKSRQELVDLVKVAGTHLNPVKSLGIIEKLDRSVEISDKQARAVASFLDRVADENQPARKLYDATVKAIQARRSVNEQMEQLVINSIPMVSRDRRVILGGRVVQFEDEFVILADKLEIVRKLSLPWTIASV